MPNLTVATIIMKDRANVLLAKPLAGPDAGLWAIPDGLVQWGESVRNTSIRIVKENLGVEVDPKMTLFLCERVEPGDHRVGVFILAEPVGIDSESATAVVGGAFAEAKWIDVRQLADIQKTEGMSEFTADAFVKFSAFLKAQAPTSGRVN